MNKANKTWFQDLCASQQHLCLIQQSGSTLFLQKYRIQLKPLGFHTNQIKDQARDWCFEDGCWCDFFLIECHCSWEEAVSHTPLSWSFFANLPEWHWNDVQALLRRLFRHFGGICQTIAFISLAISMLGCSKGWTLAMATFAIAYSALNKCQHAAKTEIFYIGMAEITCAC